MMCAVDAVTNFSDGYSAIAVPPIEAGGEVPAKGGRWAPVQTVVGGIVLVGVGLGKGALGNALLAFGSP